MATLLRYVKYLRQNHGIARRISLSPNLVEPNVPRVGLYNQRITNSTRNYETRAVNRQTAPIYSFEKSFQSLQVQLKRSGRTNKADIEKILEEIQLTGTVPSLEALLLIRCCGRPLIDQNAKEGVRLVQDIWDTLERLKIPMDVSHYNALLSVYLERDHSFSPAEFLQMMVDKQITPNRVTYHRLIEGYCRKGDIANATKIIEMMRTNNLPLCENVFNALITGYAATNDMKNAEATLETMKSSGIEPSADTYCALLCAYAKHGDVPSIMNTMTKLQSLEITLLDHHLMEIIEILATNGHTEKAAEFALKLPKDIKQDTEVGRLLIKLMDGKQTNLALEILKNTTVDTTRLQARCSFLLRAVATNPQFTNDEIINLCSHLVDEGFHVRPFALVLYHILSQNANPSVAIPVMKAWEKRGGEIREHYFWPLLRAQARASNYQGILDVLQSMVDDFKIIPSIDTLRDYTIPFMFGTWDNIIAKLLPLGIEKSTILYSIAHRSINDKKLRNAMMFMRSYPIKYPKDLFVEQMAFSLNMWDDTKSFVTILRFLADESNENDEHSDNIPIGIADDAIVAVLSTVPKYRPNIVEKLLQEYETAGVSISPEVGETVKSFFESNKAAELEPLISKLTSGTLKTVPMEQYNPYDKENTNDYIKRPVGINITDLRTQFANNLESKNEEKIFKVLRQLESLDYYSPAVLAQALELFCSTENVEGAEHCFNKFKEHCQEATLDSMKLLSFATLMVKKDRLQDAVKILADGPVLDDNEKLSRGLRVKVRSLLEAMAETRHVENTHQIFNLLKSKNYVVCDNYTLGPLVKVHLLRNEVDKAMDLFERFSNDYKCTPYKNVLATTLINAEDANALQRLTDLCTEIHGESNALVDLAILFLETGRPIQARKILETSGIQIFNDKITSAIRHFDVNDKPSCVELLTKIMRNVVRIDRGHLYNSLIEFYNEKNDYQKGLALWTEMQEIDVQPTNYFLGTLSSLLTRNGQPVPFVIQNTSRGLSQPSSTTESSRNSQRQRYRRAYDAGNKFNEALKRQDWPGAEDIIRSELRTRKDMKAMYSQLIKATLEVGEVDRAADLVRSVIHNLGGISRAVFSLVCDELLRKEKYSTIEEMGSYLQEIPKDDLDYYKILSHCMIKKLGIRKYVEGLSVDEDGIKYAEKKIHFGAMVHGLLDDPEFLEDYEKWAIKMADSQITRAVHTLWNYHFIANNDKAQELWSKYILLSNAPLVRPIIEVAVERKDPALLKKLVADLDSHPRLNVGTRCRAISGLIRAYNATEQYDEGLKVLNEASKRFRLTMLRLDCLQELKDGLEKSGKIFPFNLDKDDDNVESELRLDERLQESGRA
ncbi:leucine-rich PPR motif-containing protein, mitochondrial [Diachasmimorpha longicaudata]|uniref:leucine-rich PPR motif-containing protein, mitochondrial n=1 Tax=Diachasmimorpha longicaudata TaxID=58733 RepID=UPI0030B8B941